jgi:hypothetical protein
MGCQTQELHEDGVPCTAEFCTLELIHRSHVASEALLQERRGSVFSAIQPLLYQGRLD